MVAVDTNQDAVLSAAEEVVSRAAMEASLGMLTTTPPKQLYMRGDRSWWGRDGRKNTLDDSQVVWCRTRR